MTAGRPLTRDRAVGAVLAAGLGIDREVLTGSPGDVLGRLHDTPVPLPSQGRLPDGLATRLGQAYTRAAVLALAPQIRNGSLRLGDAPLPVDLAEQLQGRFAPDGAVLRRRLDLDVDLGSLPEDADALDVLMHARPANQEEDR